MHQSTSRITGIFVKGVVLGMGAVIGAGAVMAWTGPTGTAPNSNVSAPLNVSGTAQEKAGTLEATRFYDDNNAYYIDSNSTSVMNAISAATLTASGNITGAVFYDANDSTYYVNANGTSILNAINTAGTVTVPRLYTDNGTYLPHTNGYNYLRGHTYFNGVLYDENNAGYYLDPSSQSSVNAVAFAGLGRFDGGLVVSSNVVASFGGYVAMAALPGSSVTNYVCWYNANGYLYKSQSACGSSDRRLKENIEPIKYGLEAILKLKPVTYEWKDKEAFSKGTKIGLIAQDVLEVLPEAVTGTGTGVGPDWYGIDYPVLTAPIIKAIQELKAENDELRAEIKELRTLIESK